MHCDDLDRMIDDALSAEPIEAAPVNLSCRVQEQIRLKAAIRRERRRVLRQALVTWGSAVACIALLAALFVVADVWGRTLGLVPGGMGVADGMFSRAWYGTPVSGVVVLFAGSGVLLGMLALIGSAVGYASGRPQRPA